MLRDNEGNYYNNIPIMENSKRRENYRLKLNEKEQMLKENNFPENGKIQLTMAKQDYNSAAVILRYIDKANADETRKKVMDDL